MDCSPPGSSVYGDSPGKYIRVGCHALLRGNLSNPGSVIVHLPASLWLLSPSPSSPLLAAVSAQHWVLWLGNRNPGGRDRAGGGGTEKPSKQGRPAVCVCVCVCVEVGREGTAPRAACRGRGRELKDVSS